MEFLYDKEDQSIVDSYNWAIGRNGYVVSSKYVKGSGRKNQKNISLYFHRLITNAPKGKVIDHINRNKLDNRKENLRVCTQRENMVNCGLLKNNTSGTKGVYWSKVCNKWCAFIHFNKKKIHLGVFSDKEEAVDKRKEAFIKYFGYIERGNYV